MTSFAQVFEVARRDFVQRARSRVFLVTTLLTVGIIVSIAPLLAREFSDPPPVKVGVVGDIPGFEAALDATAAGVDLETDVTTYSDVAAGEQALTDGDVAVLVNGDELVWESEEAPRTRAAVVGALAVLARQQAIDEIGLTSGEVAQILSPESPTSRLLDPPEADLTARRVGAQIGTFVLYFSIIMFGQFILMGVMEEKQSRVVEVVLSRIPPTRLLAGKIIGIGALGLVQLLVLGGAIVLAASMIDVADIELPSMSLGILATVLLWYLLGYALFAAMYGGIGATVSKQEDAQGAAMLPTLLIIPGFAISIFSIEAPDALVPVIASFFPFTAPMVMPVRMASGAAAWWEVALSVAIVAATIYVLVRAAARIYTGAVLKIGPKVSLRDAWNAAPR